ncbi:MAG: hypothetical protein WBG46_15155 [Nonlabens sp.]
MIKRMLTSAFAIILLVGCLDKDHNKSDETIAETEMENSQMDSQERAASNGEMDYDNERKNWKNSKKYTRDEADQMANDIFNNVVVDADTISEIKNYRDYSDLRNYLFIFLKSSSEDEMENEITLREAFNEFKNTIPYYLRRKNVNSAIKDVEKELTEYETVNTGQASSESDRKENIEDIKEAFDDLEKEIIKARKSFQDNREDAMEEFMEEINSNSNQTQSERYRDAMEEYNEELEN